MVWNLSEAVQHSQKHAFLASQDKCAERTRQAIEAGGVTLMHHGSAKDYGSSLTLVGFQAKMINHLAQLEKGDIVVFQGFKGIPGTKKDHPHGHMAMYDGKHWISDFRQHHFYPGPDHQVAKPSFVVYRYKNSLANN